MDKVRFSKQLLWVTATAMLVGLLAVFLPITSSVGAKQGEQLVVDLSRTVRIPDQTSCGLAEGEQLYVDGDLYKEGQIGVEGTLIGVYHVSAVAIEPAGTFEDGACGIFTQAVFRIFDEGDIYVSALAKPGGLESEGAITSGNGAYRSVSGDYFRTTFLVDGEPSFSRVTLELDK
jgi:hypothetical protein